MWWEIYISLYPIRAFTWPISCTKEWGNISTPYEIITGVEMNTKAMGLDNEGISNEDQYQ